MKYVAALFSLVIVVLWNMSDFKTRLPLKIRQAAECFIVEDATGQALAYVYFEDLESRRIAMRRITKTDALKVAQITARALTDRASV